MTDQDKTQGEGREAQGAHRASPQAYPPANKHDAIERAGAMASEKRSFDTAKSPAPRQSADDSAVPTAVNEGRLGPGVDPVEGKR